MSTTQESKNCSLLRHALQDVLGKYDASKLADYFTPDAIIQINEKKLIGLDEIAQRLQWIKENTNKVTITIKNIFFSNDEGFDHHTAEFVDENNKKQLLKIFGYTKIIDGKIARYEDLTIALNQGDNLSSATSTTS